MGDVIGGMVGEAGGVFVVVVRVEFVAIGGLVVVEFFTIVGLGIFVEFFTIVGVKVFEVKAGLVGVEGIFLELMFVGGGLGVIVSAVGGDIAVSFVWLEFNVRMVAGVTSGGNSIMSFVFNAEVAWAVLVVLEG